MGVYLHVVCDYLFVHIRRKVYIVRPHLLTLHIYYNDF